jgi:hypothetical protein
MLISNKIVFPTKLVTRFAICASAKVTENDAANAELLYTVPAGAPALLTRLIASPQDDVDTAIRLKLYGAKANAPAATRLIMPALMTAAPVNETTAVPPTEFALDEEKPITFEAGDLVYVALGAALPAGVVFFATFQQYEAEPA